MYKVLTVENAVEAKKEIDMFTSEGYTKDDIYVFAHDKHRSKHITEATNTESTGIKEQGILESMSNMFNSRGDELRSKMKSVGMNQAEADAYEEELDKGKLVIVASKEATNNNAKPF
ncbi:general stress protein [Rossellomorea vietnamensis]|uniref:General stress protein n=1 Tax=Rossellomorea vietnamensis TaxID=218284 RepID=A0A6I6UWS1_9BACI|nr:general stress protein [Rossellomorea vietnamensis]QHE63486.1 general stress protein [Rossellomorea vietnamensis]